MKRPYSDIADPFAGHSGIVFPRKAPRFSDNHRCNTGTSVDGVGCRTGFNGHKCKPTPPGGHRCCPESLLDLAAKMSAATTPFQLVEERCARVPGPVMQRFIYWSFPRFESDIRRYSALSYEETSTAASNQSTTTSQRLTDVTNTTQSATVNARVQVDAESRVVEEEYGPFSNFGLVTSSEVDGMEVPFEQGVAMAETGKVKDVLQIGFHLSGSVDGDEVDSPGINEQEGESTSSFHVAINFDRCKITSASCDCQSGNIFFCKHVAALAIYRIRKPHLVTIRLPISETLQQMDRDQLQKLTQYLLAHHNRVLPSAQRVADLLVDPSSQLNAVRGAPDPTAGAGLVDEDRWSLEDKAAARHVSSVLQNTNKQLGAVQLQSLLAKVREMLRARDCNGSRLLTLITKELMRHCSTHSHLSTLHHNLSSPQELCRMMWDQLGLLWVCVVLNPKISSKERQSFVSKLQHWQSQPHCPQESGEGEPPIRNNETITTGRTVLSRAVDAGAMKWDDVHLNNILKGEIDYFVGRSQLDNDLYDKEGFPLWHEYVPTACARVEALRSHGCETEAVALAAAIARTIKKKWTAAFTQGANAQGDLSIACQALPEGLIGHPLHPVHILFDTLCSAEHVTAFEVALLTLGQHRIMPEGSHSQDKMIAGEVALIKRLNQLQLNEDMITILQDVSKLLIEGGSTSGLGQPFKRDSVPLHNFAKYLFRALLPHDSKLAFRVGIRAMQVPVFHRAEPNYYADAYSHSYNIDSHRAVDRSTNREASTRCFITEKLEANQCLLASSLIQTAKGEVMLLRDVVESVERTICNPQHIFQLSHDAYKAATPPLGAQDSSMLNVSLQMGMQVLRMTMHGGSWRRSEMVGWLVTCATEIGRFALISIIKIWHTLFTPVEATTMLANCVVSPNTAVRLNLHPRQREELLHCVCQMAIQCAVKDPQSCALCCLTLCESFPTAFYDTYRVILDASNQRRIDASQLYSISRFLNQKGLKQRAFTIAFAATRCLTIAFNHDAHPATSDLLWAMQLAQSLGQAQLTQMVSVVSQNITCASVLSDVLRTCTSGVNSHDTANISEDKKDEGAELRKLVNVLILNKLRLDAKSVVIFITISIDHPPSAPLHSLIVNFGVRSLRADNPILQPLLEAAINAYQVTIHTKLSHISPRHYTEFIDFLNKARETFLLSVNGHARFAKLKDNLKVVYKGKKKLLNLVALRFG